MYSGFCIHLKILRNHRFYRISIDSHQIDFKSLIQGTLAFSEVDLCAVTAYTNTNGACQSGTEKEIETGDGQMNRTRERGRGLGRLFRENIKTFLNVILHHIWDDSGFSRPNVGRYAHSVPMFVLCLFHKFSPQSVSIYK